MSKANGFPDSYQPVSIAGGIRAAMGRAPGKIAIKHGPRELTYAELVARIDKAVRAAVSDPGIIAGDHVAIISKNRIEYVEVTCGLPEAGHPVATISSRLSAAEVVAICDDAKAKVLFVDAEAMALISEGDFSTVERVIEFGEQYEDWLASGDDGTELPPVNELDTWTIPYTSGTTGAPKGVMVPFRSRVLTLFAAAAEYGCYASSDRFLAIAPMNHGAGIVFALAPLFFGGFVELLDYFDPEHVLKSLKEGKITGVFMVPTHFFGIFALDEAVLEANRPAHLRSIISNAAPLPQTTKEKIIAYFGEGLLHETYGSTEGGIVSNLRPEDQLRKTKCVGQPFPYTIVKILDDDGKECAAGEVGELFSTSPYLFNGYWEKPKETAASLRDGWLTVGDLAMRDEEGHIYIVDRKKDMVISGGVNIYPREIEEVLLAHPALSDAAVIGVPDEKWGESLKAFVVAKGEPPDPGELTGFCAEKLAKYKIPKDFEVIDAIPRNAAGKIVKSELRAREQA